MVRRYVARGQGKRLRQGGVDQGPVDLITKHARLGQALAQRLGSQGMAAGDHSQAAVVLTCPI
jgi:hypothetical protein